jgi:hypothetical protein
MFVDEQILTVLEAELSSPSLREFVASCLSFPTRPISLQMEFYNSRYSLKIWGEVGR